MNRYTFCMALLMTYAEFHRRIGNNAVYFFNHFFGYFKETDGITSDDVQWCWEHPARLVTSDIIDKLPECCFE